MTPSYFSRRVWSNAAAATASATAALAGHAALSYLLARALGPREYGAAALAFAAVAIAAAGMVLGSDGAGMRTIAAGGPDAALAPGRVLTFRLGNTAVVLAALYAIRGFFPLSPAERSFLGVYALALPFDAVVSTVATSLYGRERFAPFAAISIVSVFAALALTGAALGRGLGLAPVGVLLVAVRALAAAAALVLHRRTAGPLRPAPLGAAYGALWRPSLPFFLLSILSVLHLRANIPILRGLRGAEELGVYGVAAAVAGAALSLVQPLGLSLFPAVARAGGAAVLDRRRAFGTLRVPLAAGLALGLALFLTARPALTWALGPDYAGSVPPLRILAGAVPPIFVSATALRMLMASGRMRPALRILAVNVAVNVAANLWWIPRWGIRGAAAAAVLSALTSAGQSAVFLARLPGSGATPRSPFLARDTSLSLRSKSDMSESCSTRRPESPTRSP